MGKFLSSCVVCAALSVCAAPAFAQSPSKTGEGEAKPKEPAVKPAETKPAEAKPAAQEQGVTYKVIIDGMK